MSVPCLHQGVAIIISVETLKEVIPATAHLDSQKKILHVVIFLTNGKCSDKINCLLCHCCCTLLYLNSITVNILLMNQLQLVYF